MINNSFETLLSTAAIMALFAAPAVAQDSSVATNALEEIVITAQRRASTVQDTSFTIAVVSGDELASRQINDPASLTNITPGIQLSTVGQQLSLFVRGAGSPVANPRADPAAAYSVDGVAVARPISVNGSYFDLARIEVLKGPQGTLYGRNSTIGAVNIITNRPTFDLEGKIEGEVGNYNLFRTESVLNIPISNTFAVRGAIQTVSRDGYLSTGYNDADNYAGRIRALWEPSDTMSLLLNASYYRDQGHGAGDVPLKSAQGSFLTDDPWFVQEGPPNFNDQVPSDGNQDLRNLLLSAEFEADLGFASLTVIPAYLDTKYEALTYTAGFEQHIMNNDEQSSLELRLASPEGQTLSWIVGGLYLNDSQDGFLDLGTLPGLLQRNQINALDLVSYAAFGQLTYSISEQLRLTGGLRYSNETKKFDGYILNLDLNQTPLPGAQPLPSFGSRKFENVSYRLGVEYDINDNSLLYASIATGYKAGGFNVGAPPNGYDPEGMMAYTIGSKNTFAGGRVRFNLEAWYWDYSDVQQVQFNFVNPFPNFAVKTFNAAKQESYGLEIESSFLIGDNGTLSADITYTHSTWSEFSLPAFIFGPFNIPADDKSGVDTPFAPRWSMNISYQHVFELPNGGSLISSVRSRIRSAQTLNTTGVLGSRVSGTMSSDLSLTYETPDTEIEIQAYVNNIENEPIFSFSGVAPAGHWGTPGAPRTYGIRLVKHFR